MIETLSDFEDAVERVMKLKTPPLDFEKLKLYGLYKQATCGDNPRPKPWLPMTKEEAKWEAWESHRGFTKEKAEQRYIELVDYLSSKYN